MLDVVLDAEPGGGCFSDDAECVKLWRRYIFAFCIMFDMVDMIFFFFLLPVRDDDGCLNDCDCHEEDVAEAGGAWAPP